MDPAVQEMPVQSFITCPTAGDVLKVKYNEKGDKIVTVKGECALACPTTSD